jgi:hypothetical protein
VTIATRFLVIRCHINLRGTGRLSAAAQPSKAQNNTGKCLVEIRLSIVDSTSSYNKHGNFIEAVVAFPLAVSSLLAHGAVKEGSL